MNKSLYESFTAIFSEPRLKTYIKATREDESKALDLYKLNIQLSKNLYPLLCIFEITLRNRIVNVLVKYCKNNWFDENNNFWLDGKMSVYNNQSPTEKLREIITIEKAKKDIEKRGNRITSDTLTAELTLGFWVDILGGRYDSCLWNSYLEEVFPNTPRAYNIAREKKELRIKIQDIRMLRNRVSHHEPLFCTKRLSFKKLLRTHKDILEIINFLSEDAANLSKEHTEFNNLIESIPKYMKNDKILPHPGQLAR